eukprot:1140178-Pelagomonas_calceolata.AAC.1
MSSPWGARQYILSGCKHPIMSNMVTKRHENANRILLKDASKSPLGQALPPWTLTFFHEKVSRTNSRYPLRSRGVHTWGIYYRELSAPATAIPPASKVHHPSQLLPEQIHIHLMGVQYCKDTRASTQVALHTTLLGVGGVIYIPHTLETLIELGLDTQKAAKLAPKLHARSVQYTYKLASTKCALEKTSFSSHQQD